MLFTMRNLIGYEEAVMSSLRKLAVNESLDGVFFFLFYKKVSDTGLGYLHNLNTNEHYHFITHGYSKSSYLTAAFLMVAFVSFPHFHSTLEFQTFAISLLLRFSHHQIFVFIVEILHMFETAQPIQFPAAALLTVILALVGMFVGVVPVVQSNHTNLLLLFSQPLLFCRHGSYHKRGPQ